MRIKFSLELLPSKPKVCSHNDVKYLNDGDGGAPMYQCESCQLAGSYFNGRFTPVTIDNLGMFV